MAELSVVKSEPIEGNELKVVRSEPVGLPGIPPAPIPRGLQPDQPSPDNSLIGRYAIEPMYQGLKKAWNAAPGLAQPDWNDKGNAFHNVATGVGEASAPIMTAGALMNPAMAVRAGVRGLVGGAVGKGASAVLGAPEGIQNAVGDVGAMYGAGSTKAPAEIQSGYSAMNPGPLVKQLPEITELIPGFGKLAKVYNMGAKAVNKTNQPTVEQVPGRPALVDYNHPLAKVPSDLPNVEQTRGALSVPSTVGYPKSDGVSLPQPVVGTSSGSGSGVGAEGDLVTPSHYAGHSNPTAAHALDTKVITQKIPANVNPDSITAGQLNQWRKELGHAPLRQVDEAVRLKQLKQTLAATRSK